MFWPYAFVCATQPQIAISNIFGLYFFLSFWMCLISIFFQVWKCVFIGYSSNSKSYICLNSLNGQIIISRDVIFHEDDFSTARGIGKKPKVGEQEYSDIINPICIIKIGTVQTNHLREFSTNSGSQKKSGNITFRNNTLANNFNSRIATMRFSCMFRPKPDILEFKETIYRFKIKLWGRVQEFSIFCSRTHMGLSSSKRTWY